MTDAEGLPAVEILSETASFLVCLGFYLVGVFCVDFFFFFLLEKSELIYFRERQPETKGKQTNRPFGQSMVLEHLYFNYLSSNKTKNHHFTTWVPTGVKRFCLAKTHHVRAYWWQVLILIPPALPLPPVLSPSILYFSPLILLTYLAFIPNRTSNSSTNYLKLIAS